MPCASEHVFWSLLLILNAASLPPETARRLFQLRGASASKFKPAGFGGPYIFWIWHSLSQSLAVSRYSSWEVWGYALLTSYFSIFCLPALCLPPAPKRKTLLCLLSHLPASSSDAAILLYWAAPALGEISAGSEIH